MVLLFCVAVTAVHCNAVSEWSKVITLARDSTVRHNLERPSLPHYLSQWH